MLIGKAEKEESGQENKEKREKQWAGERSVGEERRKMGAESIYIGLMHSMLLKL